MRLYCKITCLKIDSMTWQLWPEKKCTLITSIHRKRSGTSYYLTWLSSCLLQKGKSRSPVRTELPKIGPSAAPLPLPQSTSTSSVSQATERGPSQSQSPPMAAAMAAAAAGTSTANTTKESNHLLNKVAAAMPLLPPLPTASTNEPIDHTKHAAGR